MGLGDDMPPAAAGAPAHDARGASGGGGGGGLGRRRGASADSAAPEPAGGCRAALHRVACAPSTAGQRVMCAMFWTAVGVACIALFAAVLPRFITGVVQPFVQLLQRELTPAQIGAVCFAACAVLPFFIVIGVVPFLWVAGIALNFWVALPVTMAGTATAMTLQFWLARHALRDRVARMMERPKRSGLKVALKVVELAGPAKTVVLLRLGPFPGHVLNYALGLCPTLSFPVYIACSVLADLPARSLQIFFGRSLTTLADLLRGRVTNPGVAVYNVLVLLVGVAFVVLSVVLSRRMLRRLEEEELAREEAEARAAEQGDEEAAAARAGAGEGAGAGAAGPPGGGELPAAVQGKLAAGGGGSAAAAKAGSGGGGSAAGSSGDLEVVVLDDGAGSMVRSSSGSSFIPAGRPPAPAAALERAGSIGGSSVGGGSFAAASLRSTSSFRSLLGGWAQRSA